MHQQLYKFFGCGMIGVIGERHEQSFHAIVEKLEQQGGDGHIIAGEMRKRAARLFENGTVSTQSPGT